MTAYIAYVTLAEQKEYSDILHTGKDTMIETLIRSASARVKNYLNDFSPREGQRDSDYDYELDSNGEPEVYFDSNGFAEIKPEIKQAVMMLVDMTLNMHRYPPQLLSSGSYLPDMIVNILYPLRDPVTK